MSKEDCMQEIEYTGKCLQALLKALEQSRVFAEKKEKLKNE